MSKKIELKFDYYDSGFDRFCFKEKRGPLVIQIDWKDWKWFTSGRDYEPEDVIKFKEPLFVSNYNKLKKEKYFYKIQHLVKSTKDNEMIEDLLEGDYPSSMDIGDRVTFIPMARHCNELGITCAEGEGVITAIKFTPAKVFYDIVDDYHGFLFNSVDSAKVKPSRYFKNKPKQRVSHNIFQSLLEDY